MMMIIIILVVVYFVFKKNKNEKEKVVVKIREDFYFIKKHTQNEYLKIYVEKSISFNKKIKSYAMFLNSIPAWVFLQKKRDELGWHDGICNRNGKRIRTARITLAMLMIMRSKNKKYMHVYTTRTYMRVTRKNPKKKGVDLK